MMEEEIVIRTKYLIGDEVFFKPSSEAVRGIVLALVVGAAKSPEYVVRWEDMSVVQHNVNELDSEPRVI